MRWEQRRPVWPLIGGFACLFGLAIAAPYCWQHPVLNVHELIERRQLVQPVEHQQLPPRPTFGLDTLQDIHASLKKMVDTLEVSRPQASTERVIARTRPRVIVGSADDRLAMLDTRKTKPAFSLVEPTPLIVESKRKQVERAKSAVLAERELSTAVKTPLLRQPPKLLIDRLEKLANNPIAFEWATAVLTRVRQLTQDPTTPSATGLQILAELRQLAVAGHIRSLEMTDPAVQQNWLQAAQGLQRRLGIWELLIERDGLGTVALSQNAVSNLLPVLSNIDSLLAGTVNGQPWRDYLLVDQLAAAASEGFAEHPNLRLKVAQEVLSRLNDPRLSDEQRTFISTEPIASLARELRPWAAGPVDLEKLLAILERYETDGQMLFGSAIAQLTQRMQWSEDRRLQAAADELQKEFRGANMRIALNHEMFNRMIPDQPSINAPVHEHIAGTQVNGSSRTTSEVEIELLPTDKAWRIGLHAKGHVYSQTRSDTWPVRVRNSARYQYEAEKVIKIGSNGLEIGPTQAQAQGEHQFLGAESEFDRVPLMGAIFRKIAKNENQKSRPKAKAQVKSRVAQKARTRMDQEADAKLRKLETRFANNVLAPFSQLALAAEPVDMFTTADRAVMQLRLANLDQLAAHTPRPSAPADSLISMQVHETAINNALAGLDLEGRRFTIPELHAFLSEKLGREEATPPEDLPARAKVEFAKHDAIHVSFVDDRLELVLSFRELGRGRDKIQNFQVHAYYRPQLDGLALMMIRDDTLQFSGPSLKTGARVVLHSVMGKLLGKGHEIGGVRNALEADKRLSGLMITQLVIDDGWMALALGPVTTDRTAWRTPSYRLDAEVVK